MRRQVTLKSLTCASLLKVKPKAMSPILLVLSLLSFATSGVGYLSPFFVTVSLPSQSATDVGALLVNSSALTVGYLSCKSDNCTANFGLLHSISLSLHGLGFVLVGTGIAGAVTNRLLMAMWGFSIAFFFQAAGTFTFFFRTLPLFRSLYSATSWGFLWASYVAGAGLILTFVSMVVSGHLAIVRAMEPVAPVSQKNDSAAEPTSTT